MGDVGIKHLVQFIMPRAATLHIGSIRDSLDNNKISKNGYEQAFRQLPNLESLWIGDFESPNHFSLMCSFVLFEKLERIIVSNDSSSINERVGLVRDIFEEK